MQKSTSKPASKPASKSPASKPIERSGDLARLILNVAVCSLCSGLGVCIISMNMAISSTTAAVYAPSEAYSTFPVAVLLLGMMSMSLPVSWLFSRFGRRFGFLACVGIGLLGCGLLALGMYLKSWWLMSLGYALIGSGISTNSFYYFAANDGAPAHLSGRISGAVLMGGLGAALLGPRAAVFANGPLFKDSFGPFSPELIGVPILLAIFFCSIGLAICLFRPIQSSESAATARSSSLNLSGLRRVVSSPRFWSIVLIPACSYGAMTLIMNATTPMMALCGFALSSSSTVISWHLFAMFAPAPLCGILADKYGAEKCAGLGFICLGLAGPITFMGVSFWHFSSALILLGIGWALANVSGAKLIILYSRTALKSETEALNTVIIAAFNIFSALFAGIIFAFSGWELVIGISTLIVALGLLAVLMTTVLPSHKAAHKAA